MSCVEVNNGKETKNYLTSSNNVHVLWVAKSVITRRLVFDLFVIRRYFAQNKTSLKIKSTLGMLTF